MHTIFEGSFLLNAEKGIMLQNTALIETLSEDTIIHRIGGNASDNLILKPEEEVLIPPGFSALKAGTPAIIAAQIRAAFPKAAKLHEQAKIIGSASVGEIRKTGFDVMENPTKKLPNHVRVIHPQGIQGFSQENLQALETAFVNIYLE